MIFSYKLPTQVVRLVDALLESSDSTVVIHHDSRNTRISGLSNDSRVTLHEGFDEIQWGHISFVRCVLAELSQLPVGTFDHVVLLSGQDYPIGDLRVLESTFREADAILTTETLDFRPRWGRRWGDGDDTAVRYLYRWFRLPSCANAALGRKSLAGFLVRLANLIQPVLVLRDLPHARGWHVGIRRARHPFSTGLRLRKGWPWMMLSCDAVEVVLSRSPFLLRYYARSLIPEESLFQTVLGASSLTLVEGDITFTDWRGEHGESHPQILGVDEIRAAANSGYYFARKLDMTISPEALDFADRIRRSPESSGAKE